MQKWNLFLVKFDFLFKNKPMFMFIFFYYTIQLFFTLGIFLYPVFWGIVYASNYVFYISYGWFKIFS